MLPNSFPFGPGRASRSVTIALGFALALFTAAAHAANETVEMETDLHGAVGKLKDVPRPEAPEIDPASDEGQQALARMKLPAGLKASLWAAEPMLANPVAFNFDEKGRVFVAETFRYRTSVLDIRDYMWTLEDDLANRTQADFLASIRKNFGEEGIKQLSKETERVQLIEDTNGDGVADKSTVYAENFRSPIDGIAAGVLARHGEVWFTNIPALWKFTGTEKAETRTELLRGFGLRFSFTGHDFHGLIFGPDGRIYFSIGDRAASVKTQEGTTIDAPDCGSVFRCYPDGSHLELFATGLRNPQSLLFNEYGDLFTGDNDSDQGDQERLVHIVENGDSGWRIGYQHAPRGNAGPWNAERLWLPRHPSQPAYLLPPICNIEDGPSGIAYYPGTGLTPDYAGKIFITHFKGAIASSGIYTYQVKPSGASYAIVDEAPFLRNALPTDVRFGPDGRLYYSDWAEGWPKSKRGRIYAIFDPNRVNDPLVKSTQQLIASDYTKKTDADLAGLLAHPDWRVRLDAQLELANRGNAGIETLAAVAGKTDGSPLARRHAVWGLGQLGVQFPAAVKALRPLLQANDAEVRAQAAKELGDCNDHASDDALVNILLSDTSSRVKFFAAQSLGKLKYAGATSALLASIRGNNDADAYLRHALVMGLVGCATPAELTGLKTDESRAARLAAVLALRRLANAGVTVFLTDSDPLIVSEAVEAIYDLPIVAAYPAVAAFIDHPVASESIMLRALNAQFRIGTSANAAALANYVVRADAPEKLREEALTLLSLWPAPPARDRLIGIYRPLPDKTRDSAVGIGALNSHLSELLSTATPEALQLATLQVVAALKLDSAVPLVRAVVANNNAPETARTAALDMLNRLADPQLPQSIEAALASNSAELRLAALPLSTKLHPESAPATLARLLENGTLAEQRTAYISLGDLARPEADKILAAELKKLAAGKVAPGAQIELLDAAAKRSSPEVKQLLAARDAALARNPDPLAAFQVSLEGGDAKKGRGLFYYHPVLACVRCHTADSAGGEAGPNLAGIGARKPREYILESIVKPNARIADGFDTQIVTLKSGAITAGVFVSENDREVTLRDSNGKNVVIEKSAIATRTSAPSSMPEIFGTILTKAELRDLVEFVDSLKVRAPTNNAPLRALVPPPTD
ncbi:MAG TPA: HEAT repeat domain-containing protein [Lacunisphaera sp.]|jgi:quinoprotein glucose dehydrogenase